MVIFDPQHWSGGLGTRALNLWTAVTFAEKPAHLITMSGNARMIRAAERVGYRECARIPEARSWDGQRWDSVKLGMLRREFESARMTP
ncbi:GNAT family N-acetyltransferase [Deinococcus psychrotolerans]|uniref:GNAT family N-acetyltransferase n=1 Tax=Deinococcus psychrotolerans TaxID=2489213 RepID=UPI001F14BD21|nr:GNAT family N-acetyltransferase [Deinococcus psychrotolerans]